MLKGVETPLSLDLGLILIYAALITFALGFLSYFLIWVFDD
jgi:hypothetical protein